MAGLFRFKACLETGEIAARYRVGIDEGNPG